MGEGGLNEFIMKTLFFRVTTILAMAIFGFTPMVNAAGPGGGGIGGGGADCGYISFMEYCDATRTSERTTCDSSIGGESSCTLVNCDGTQIELGGPLRGC